MSERDSRYNRKKNANYILAVKGNQKELYSAILDTFKITTPKESYTHEINSDHGRIESRIVNTLPASIIESQLDLDKWANIQSIVRTTYINHCDNSKESRYFISTLPHKEVEKIALSIRSHWQIENKLHWVLDV